MFASSGSHLHSSQPCLTQRVSCHCHSLKTGCYLSQPEGQVKSTRQFYLEGFPSKVCHANQQQRTGITWASHLRPQPQCNVCGRTQSHRCWPERWLRWHWIQSQFFRMDLAWNWRHFAFHLFLQKEERLLCGRQWFLHFGCTAWFFFCLQNPVGYYAR